MAFPLDDLPKYMLFLVNVFHYMDEYRYEAGMKAIIDEITVILADILGHSSIDITRIHIMTTGTEHRKKIERL